MDINNYSRFDNHSHSEFSNLTGANAIAALRQVMANIYQSDKFKSRGEFGELLLHVIIREIYNTIPAISKIFYKDGPNETVKGFDAVHVIATEDSLELWLGEVKFYNNIGKAIYDVAKESLNFAYFTPAINNAQSARTVAEEKYAAYVTGTSDDVDAMLQEMNSQVETSISRQ